MLARYAAHPTTRSNLPPSWYTRLPGMWQDNAPCAGRTVADFHHSRRVPIQVRVRRGSRLHDCAAGIGRLHLAASSQALAGVRFFVIRSSVPSAPLGYELTASGDRDRSPGVLGPEPGREPGHKNAPRSDFGDGAGTVVPRCLDAKARNRSFPAVPARPNAISSSIWEASVTRRKQREPVYATCRECGQSMRVARAWQKFCCDQHRDRYNARRLRRAGKEKFAQLQARLAELEGKR